MPIIEIKNLKKKYPKVKRYRDIFLHPLKNEYIHALKGITLNIQKGSILGLLGPNGAGKTTLIKILATLVYPTTGTVNIKGFDIFKDCYKIRKIIGYVTADERSFYWRLTGRQNLDFFACLNNIDSSERRYRIDRILEQTELINAGDTVVKDYSTGMKQRLAIARGLICNPEILLLDEPTKSLDPFSAQNLRQFIKEKIIQDLGHTAIIATHNLHEAYEICSHIAVINDGYIISSGLKDSVLHDTYTNTYTIKFSNDLKENGLNSFNDISKYNSVNFSKNEYCITTEYIENVLHEMYKSGLSIVECVRNKVSLDDFFVSLINKKEK